MATKTSIEWTDRTWNPVRGCSRVSPGCENCYAEVVARRFSKPGMPYEGLADRRGWTRSVRPAPERVLLEPLSWRKPQRVFVNSMSDLFHEGLTDEQIDRVFVAMMFSPRHTFQVLTKRAERMRAYVSAADRKAKIAECFPFDPFDPRTKAAGSNGFHTPVAWPLPNVWLGVSVEDQQRADKRIPHLLATPAAVRFLSVEPLLGPVDLHGPADEHRRWLRSMPYTVRGLYRDDWQPPLDWVIVGGESGPGARPCDVAWIRSVVEQCKAAGVPCFVKQLGGNVRWNGCQGGYLGGPSNVWPPGAAFEEANHGRRVRLRDRKGGDMDEWPPDLRVREFPAAGRS